MVARWRVDRLHLRSRRLRRPLPREARRHGPRTAHRRPRVRRSSRVFPRRHAARLRLDAQRRQGKSVDDGSADATREGTDLGPRRRFPALMVTGRPVDRVLVRPRQHAPVRQGTLGAPADRRHLRHASRRHGAQTDHRARRILRQPEIRGRQPPRDGVLHAGRADTRDPALQPAGHKRDGAQPRHTSRLDRHRDRRDGRRGRGTWREVQPVVSAGERCRLHPQGRRRRGHLLHERQAGTERRRPRGRVVAGWPTRRVPQTIDGAADDVAENVQPESAVRAHAHRDSAVVQHDRRSVRDDGPADQHARREPADRDHRHKLGDRALSGQEPQRHGAELVAGWRHDHVRHRRLQPVLQRLQRSGLHTRGSHGGRRADRDHQPGRQRVSRGDERCEQQRVPVDGARRQAVRLPFVRARRRRPAHHEPRDQGGHDADERLRQLSVVVTSRRSDHVLARGAGRLRDLHDQTGRHRRQAPDFLERQRRAHGLVARR